MIREAGMGWTKPSANSTQWIKGSRYRCDSTENAPRHVNQHGALQQIAFAGCFSERMSCDWRGRCRGPISPLRGRMDFRGLGRAERTPSRRKSRRGDFIECICAALRHGSGRSLLQSTNRCRLIGPRPTALTPLLRFPTSRVRTH